MAAEGHETTRDAICSPHPSTWHDSGELTSQFSGWLKHNLGIEESWFNDKTVKMAHHNSDGGSGTHQVISHFDEIARVSIDTTA
jgi:hypothetical protein